MLLGLFLIVFALQLWLFLHAKQRIKSCFCVSYIKKKLATKIYDLATKIFLLVASWLPNAEVNFEPCESCHSESEFYYPNEEHYDFNMDKVCNSLRTQVLVDTCTMSTWITEGQWTTLCWSQTCFDRTSWMHSWPKMHWCFQKQLALKLKQSTKKDFGVLALSKT